MNEAEPISQPAPEPTPQPGKAWSFHYAGPAHPQDVRMCPQCASAQESKCIPPTGTVPHGSPVADCTSCSAALRGFCPVHCGALRAIDEHPAYGEQWKRAAALLILEVSAMPAGAKVAVRARGMSEHEEHPDELEIQVSRLA